MWGRPIRILYSSHVTSLIVLIHMKFILKINVRKKNSQRILANIFLNHHMHDDDDAQQNGHYIVSTITSV